MPPMICSNWADTNGYETQSRADFYGKRAKGGVGLIIIEATAISPDSKIIDTALGIWDNSQIDQFKRISYACRSYSAEVLLQICHNGGGNPDLKKVKKDFTEAALRAEKAGLTGVEIHGAHGFLLNKIAKEGNTGFILDLVKSIRRRVKDTFILGYRLGLNDPLYKRDIEFSLELQNSGIDVLNVSYGVDSSTVSKPDSFRLSPVTYGATVIKKAVNIPVIGVNLIQKPKDAHWLIDRGYLDMVAIGRGLLADPNWVIKANSKEEIKHCVYCKPRCMFGLDGRKCPRAI